MDHAGGDWGVLAWDGDLHSLLPSLLHCPFHMETLIQIEAARSWKCISSAAPRQKDTTHCKIGPEDPLL